MGTTNLISFITPGDFVAFGHQNRKRTREGRQEKENNMSFQKLLGGCEVNYEDQMDLVHMGSVVAMNSWEWFFEQLNETQLDRAIYLVKTYKAGDTLGRLAFYLLKSKKLKRFRDLFQEKGVEAITFPSSLKLDFQRCLIENITGGDVFCSCGTGQDRKVSWCFLVMWLSMDRKAKVGWPQVKAAVYKAMWYGDLKPSSVREHLKAVRSDHSYSGVRLSFCGFFSIESKDKEYHGPQWGYTNMLVDQLSFDKDDQDRVMGHRTAREHVEHVLADTWVRHSEHVYETRKFSVVLLDKRIGLSTIVDVILDKLWRSSHRALTFLGLALVARRNEIGGLGRQRIVRAWEYAADKHVVSDYKKYHRANEHVRSLVCFALMNHEKAWDIIMSTEAFPMGYTDMVIPPIGYAIISRNYVMRAVAEIGTRERLPPGVVGNIRKMAATSFTIRHPGEKEAKKPPPPPPSSDSDSDDDSDGDGQGDWTAGSDDDPF